MSAAQDKKKKGSKKTGTLTWTEYCECEMLRQQDENQKLQLEMENLKRHYDEVGDHYEERLDFQRRSMQSSSGTLTKQLKLNEELKKENEELKKEVENIKKAHIKMAEEFDETYQEGTLALRLEVENLKERVLTDQQLEDLQGEAYKAGRKGAFEEISILKAE
jgi:hypothetical protein